jgi:TRAP-type mannitol/chloroaromatic compound transport system substrate-binding protein
MPAGQVVPAFEVLDATHKKVLDGAHAWGGYWTGKNKTAVLFTGGPGGTFGMDFTDFMGWMYFGGGWELYQEFFQKELKMNVVAYSVLPSGPQAFGWFNKPITSVADMKGMKCRQTGIAGEVWKELGFTVVNMPGGEIIPSAQRGVIDCAEWVGGVEDMRLGFHNVWKFHYSPGVHENTTVGELLFNKDGVQILQTPRDILLEFIKGWDKIAADESAKNPFFKKVLESQKAYASIVVPYKRFYFPPYSFMANYYFPPKAN